MSAYDERQLRAASRRAALMTLFGAALVVASLAYSAISLTNLAEKRELLAATNELFTKQLQDSKRELQEARRDLAATEQSLQEARCALGASRSAIEAFHQQNYGVAIELYTEALKCDPGNAYLLNLMAYSQFKAGKLEEALQTERQSIKADPNYAWGYFDLARFLCKAGPSYMAEAKQRIDEAITLRPGLKVIMQQDGEFKRLCGKLVPAPG